MSNANILKFWRDVEVFTVPEPTKITPKKFDPYKALKPGNPEGVCREFSYGSTLPWDAKHKPELISSDKTYWSHTIFIGVAQKSFLSKVIRRELKLDESDSEFEDKSTGNGCVGVFVIDDCGRPVGGTFVPAGFAIGLTLVRQNIDLDIVDKAVRDYSEAFDIRNGSVNIDDAEEKKGNEDGLNSESRGESADRNDKPPVNIVDWDLIATEADKLAQINEPGTHRIYIHSRLQSRKWNGKKWKEDTSTILNSFHVADLSTLVEEEAKGLLSRGPISGYMSQPLKDGLRKDVLTSPKEMISALRPERLPLGRWPSPKLHHLMLAQQAAVSEILTPSTSLSKSTGLVAVNGPPGTGKTTLLRDVIAAVVTARASRIANLSSSDQMFEPMMKVKGKSLNPISDAIMSGTSIVVSSNNNAAVENISLELPKLSSISEADHYGRSYFHSVANNMLAGEGEFGWGILSAALGNAVNRKKFSNAFFGVTQKEKDEGSAGQSALAIDVNDISSRQTMTEVLALAIKRPQSERRNEWDDAKRKFASLKTRVENHRSSLSDIATDIEMLDALQEKVESSRRSVEQANNALVAIAASYEQALKIGAEDFQSKSGMLPPIAGSIKDTSNKITKIDARLDLAKLKHAPSIFDRMFHSVGFKTVRMASYIEAVTSLGQDKLDLIDALEVHEKRLEEAKTKVATSQNNLEQLQALYAKNVRDIEVSKTAAEATLKKAILAQGAARDRIHSFEKSGAMAPRLETLVSPYKELHLLGSWVSPEFDLLRSQLFLAGLDLHRATIIAEAETFSANFLVLEAMLKSNGPEFEPVAALVWNILFFAVPVVSTSLAAVGRLFDKVKAAQLGWLFVDEAGQAQPQHVAGIMWRCRRAVIIGDPKQIEPVVTIPEPLVRFLEKRNMLTNEEIGSYAPGCVSAQEVADRPMEIGAWIGDVWTGMPLRAHRRCIDPMFSVSNDIAYEGQMVQANRSPSQIQSVLGESAWIDIRSTTSGDGQVVSEEISAFTKLAIDLKSQWPTVDGGKAASIFAITPFVKVKNEIDRVATNTDIHCGTIHTFQGREADVVILVLGTQNGAKGSGGRKWASAKSNILNVAITRARLRLYVIGNYDDWSSQPYFNQLARTLRVIQYEDL